MKKRIIAITSAFVLVVSFFTVNVNAEYGTVAEVISENYTSNTATYFKGFTGNHANVIANNAVTLKTGGFDTENTYSYSGRSNVIYAGSQIGIGKTDGSRILDGTKKLPDFWMLEFDIKAVNNNTAIYLLSRHQSNTSLKIYIKPDIFEPGKTFIVRAFVDDDYANDGDGRIAHARETTRIYIAEKGNEPATRRWLTYGTEFTISDSSYSNTAANYLLGFGINVVSGKNWMKSGASADVTPVKYYNGSGNTNEKTLNLSTAALETEYILDNITVYEIPKGQDVLLDKEFKIDATKIDSVEDVASGELCFSAIMFRAAATTTPASTFMSVMVAFDKNDMMVGFATNPSVTIENGGNNLTSSIDTADCYEKIADGGYVGYYLWDANMQPYIDAIELD